MTTVEIIDNFIENNSSEDTKELATDLYPFFFLQMMLS
jgi:hypothetical protein